MIAQSSLQSRSWPDLETDELQRSRALYPGPKESIPWPAQDRNSAPTRNPVIFFSLSPGEKKELWQGPSAKWSGGPWYKFPCRELKRRSLLAIAILHCTLDANNTQAGSTASACYSSSADGVAAKLSLQDWEMDFLFYKQNHVQMNWGWPTDHRIKSIA